MLNSDSRQAACGYDVGRELGGFDDPRSNSLKMTRWLIAVTLSIGCFALLAIGLTGSIVSFFCGGVSKKSITITRMTVTKRRILLYAHQNNRLPKSLMEIPTLATFDNSIKDGWGRSFEYQINKNNTVTLKSWGRDGLLGGNGEDADIILSFPTQGVGGGWSDPLIDWLND